MKEKESKKEKVDSQTRIFDIFRELIPYIVIIIVVILIRSFIVTPVRVKGDSMYPYLKDGEVLILNKLDKSYKRFDIVVASVYDGSQIIKRVIGLPGETVAYKDCKLYINGEEVEDFVDECITNDFSLQDLYNYEIIPEGYYFVMGDNRLVSLDSRRPEIGLISESKIEGSIAIRLYPFNRFGRLK